MGNRVRKRAAWMTAGVLALMLLGMITGCAGAPGMTSKDVDRRHYHSMYSNWLLFQEDMDSILLIDRPIRLSPLNSR